MLSAYYLFYQMRFILTLMNTFFVGVILCNCCYAEELQRYTFEEAAMSMPVRIVVCAENEAVAKAVAEAAFRRVHELNDIMTDYDSASELMQMCRNGGQSGQPVAVSDDLFRVLQKSRQISIDSGGAFDVTVGPMVRLWRRARRLHKFPEQQLLDEAKTLVGNELWEIDETSQTVTLKRDKMRFDLGGIAKGDIIDQAILTLKEAGITAALVDAGGDLRVYGIPPSDKQLENDTKNKTGWLIGVSAHGKEVARLVSGDIALASSGDLTQYVKLDGKRYSHIVDPKTGLGLTNQAAVTVFASDAITADALASTLSILPPEEGLQLLKRYNGTAAMISRLITDSTKENSETESTSQVEVWYSENWERLMSGDFDG